MYVNPDNGSPAVDAAGFIKIAGERGLAVKAFACDPSLPTGGTEPDDAVILTGSQADILALLSEDGILTAPLPGATASPAS